MSVLVTNRHFGRVADNVSTYGLSKDLGLEKKDYSLASSMTSIATLAWQPFSAYLIVRVNPRILMTVNVFCWGTSAACMAASNGRASLLVTRFLLGLFEAANIPLVGGACM